MLNIPLNLSGQLRKFYVAKQSLDDREKRAFLRGAFGQPRIRKTKQFLNIDIAVTFTPIKVQQTKNDTIGV